MNFLSSLLSSVNENGKTAEISLLLFSIGKVEVNIGREELIFEGGPFSYYGIQTLNQVIESPSSPLLAFRGPHNWAGTPASATSGDIGKHLRKTSTQQSIEVNPNLLNKRHSAQVEMGMGVVPSRAGSIFAAFPGFVPDYTVKAVTDVLYMKIKRPTYMRAMKASLMGKKASHSGELNERELEHLLEKVRSLDSEDAF